MKNASAVPRQKRGFTLIEMLIVVAIIAVLVAVSIPLVNNSLERARVNTDMANERAARAAAMIYLLNGGEIPPEISDPLCYDAVNGELVPYDPSNPPTFSYGKCADHKGGYIFISMMDDGRMTMMWDGVNIKNYEAHLYSLYY